MIGAKKKAATNMSSTSKNHSISSSVDSTPAKTRNYSNTQKALPKALNRS
jgi:hypothetical protein